MTPEFKIGDLVKYYTYRFPTQMWGDDIQEKEQQAVITGFYDHETGDQLSSDFTTHDKVIVAAVAGSAGQGRVMLHDLELLSSVEKK